MNNNSRADLNPALIRIRMHKELLEFPGIPGAIIKKINENIWSLSGDGLSFKNKMLPHNNFISKKPNGHFDIISILQFNEYLSGVVSSEMPIKWPLEALKAQAVIARSFALARIQENRKKLFHLDSDQSDQVFLLTSSEKTKMAVSDTDGIVLRSSDGAVLKAYFHADCGGKTVPASEVWGPNAIDSGTAEDPWCALKKSNQWSFEIAKSEFLERLLLSELNPQFSHIGDKTQWLSLGGVAFSIQKLREMFGYYKIRSSIDSIVVTENNVKITGQGFGHGAGLCQWGTLAMVRQGKSYINVLNHYYPKAKIDRDSVRLSLNRPSINQDMTVSN